MLHILGSNFRIAYLNTCLSDLVAHVTNQIMSHSCTSNVDLSVRVPCIYMYICIYIYIYVYINIHICIYIYIYTRRIHTCDMTICVTRLLNVRGMIRPTWDMTDSYI